MHCGISLCFASTVVYDNGSTTFDYGLEVAGFQVADDFIVDTPSLLTGARFWTVEGEGIRSGAVPFDGHIDYWVYDSELGYPNQQLATGVAASITRNDLGVHNHWYGTMRRFEYEISFATPIAVQPNTTYFFGLHLLETYPNPNGEIYWSTADGFTLGLSSHSRDGGVGVWEDVSTTIPGVYGADHLAFQLYGTAVPEPSTLGLLFSCIVAASCPRKLSH